MVSVSSVNTEAEGGNHRDGLDDECGFENVDEQSLEDSPAGSGRWKWIALALAACYVADKAFFSGAASRLNCFDDSSDNVRVGTALSQQSTTRSVWSSLNSLSSSRSLGSVEDEDLRPPARQPRQEPRFPGLLEVAWRSRRLSSSSSSGSSSGSDCGSSGSSSGSAGAGASSGSSGSAGAGASSGSSGSSGSAGCDSGHASHAYEAMFFMIMEMFVGAFLLFMTLFPRFQGMQQTVMLFILGMIYALVHNIDGVVGALGPLGRSFQMWMEIDPHLLLFTLLPPLLAGDAMAIDTQVAKLVGSQCLYLAGPGVLFGTLLTAGFLYLYLATICGYAWTFTLCMVTGSILCATDPVAVVALLKELGAPPALTVQIQGESLLNDGTAIVVFTVFYRALEGYEWDASLVMMFCVKTALYAFLLGVMMGYTFYLWIKACNNKFDHSSSMLQVSLTLAGAYAGFLVSEGLFHISGVLATVASSLILAHKMWPEVVCHETMHTIWHMFEYLGNTIIFFLAGALVGNSMQGIDWADYFHLLVIYLVLVVIRGGIIFGSIPILNKLGKGCPVTYADAAVMTWGGLRGAVGLALAIQVAVSRADNQIPEKEAQRVLFYVGGIAFLTLVVNATTCPVLVKRLGITQLPESKRKVLREIYRKLEEMVEDKVNHIETEQLKQEVKFELMHMLQHVEKHLLHEHHEERTAERRRSSAASLTNIAKGRDKGREVSTMRRVMEIQPIRECVAEYNTTVTRFKSMNVPLAYFVDAFGEFVEAEDEQSMDALLLDQDGRLNSTVRVVKTAEAAVLPPALQGEATVPDDEFKDCNWDWQRTINESFLNLVKSAYWNRLKNRHLAAGEADVLFNSIFLAMNDPMNISDFKHIMTQLDVEDVLNEGKDKMGNPNWSLTAIRQESKKQVLTEEEAAMSPMTKKVADFVDGSSFSMVMTLTIIANSAIVMMEEEMVAPTGEVKRFLWALELFFNILFTVEFVLKFIVLKLAYYKDSWNVFDFGLVVTGWFGIVLTTIAWIVYGDDESDAGSEASLTRCVKILKILRAVRMVRLARLFSALGAQLRGKEARYEVGRSMRTLEVLETYCQCHLQSQQDIIRYFGRKDSNNNPVPGVPEVARCIMQSQVGVLKCIVLGHHTCRLLREQGNQIGRRLLKEIRDSEHTFYLMEDLERYIVESKDTGILRGGEAEILIHSMHHLAQDSFNHISEMRCGWLDADHPWEIDNDEAFARSSAWACADGEPGSPGSADYYHGQLGGVSNDKGFQIGADAGTAVTTVDSGSPADSQVTPSEIQLEALQQIPETDGPEDSILEIGESPTSEEPADEPEPTLGSDASEAPIRTGNRTKAKTKAAAGAKKSTISPDGKTASPDGKTARKSKKGTDGKGSVSPMASSTTAGSNASVPKKNRPTAQTVGTPADVGSAP